MLPTSAAVILAFDTSGVTADVALVDEHGHVLATRTATSARHSTLLLALVDELLSARGLRPADLAGIACGGGPGSFTGLRVGLAMAKGLALPFATPFWLVPSLTALTLDLHARTGADFTGLIVPCIDAGKGEVHARIVPIGAGAAPLQAPPPADLRLTPEQLCERAVCAAAAEAGALYLGGSGVDRHRDRFTTSLGAAALASPAPGPTGAAVARLALARRARGERDDLARAVPQYGRPPDITKPRAAAKADAAGRPRGSDS